MSKIFAALMLAIVSLTFVGAPQSAFAKNGADDVVPQAQPADDHGAI